MESSDNESFKLFLKISPIHSRLSSAGDIL
jgi:hypothetical protein